MFQIIGIDEILSHSLIQLINKLDECTALTIGFPLEKFGFQADSRLNLQLNNCHVLRIPLAFQVREKECLLSHPPLSARYFIAGEESIVEYKVRDPHIEHATPIVA